MLYEICLKCIWCCKNGEQCLCFSFGMSSKKFLDWLSLHTTPWWWFIQSITSPGSQSGKMYLLPLLCKASQSNSSMLYTEYISTHALGFHMCWDFLSELTEMKVEWRDVGSCLLKDWQVSNTDILGCCSMSGMAPLKTAFQGCQATESCQKSSDV